jgi:hypothetical protein
MYQILSKYSVFGLTGYPVGQSGIRPDTRYKKRPDYPAGYLVHPYFIYFCLPCCESANICFGSGSQFPPSFVSRSDFVPNFGFGSNHKLVLSVYTNDDVTAFIPYKKMCFTYHKCQFVYDFRWGRRPVLDPNPDPDPDPKHWVKDLVPIKSFSSLRIRIHNTAYL